MGHRHGGEALLLTRTTVDCLLIADDLTGACDAAIHFAARGRRTMVPIGVGQGIDLPAVLAISTDSRDLDAAAQRRLLADVARRLPWRDASILFKKIDSTLRGNPGGEIAAAAEAFACDLAVITPAFPAMHRVVEGGILRTPGAAPVDVARLLGDQGASGDRFLTFDANCDDDLDRIVAGALAGKGRVLWAGSGGLAAALARTLPRGSDVAPRALSHEGPVVFCIGSDHPATLAQLERLSAARTEHVVLRRVEIERMQSAAPRALVLSGGDTASAACRAAGVQRIHLQDEIVPGIPRGVLGGGVFDGLPVATKSGGFGQPDALIQVADFFTCQNSL